MSNLCTCVLLCVSFYLPRMLNKAVVAWPGEKLAPSICVPTSWLCFPARLWLWSWFSMSCRSARRKGGEKRSCIHKPIPKAEGVISETRMKKVKSLLSVDINDIRDEGENKSETRSILKFHNCEFVVHVICLTSWWRTRLYWGSLARKRPGGSFSEQLFLWLRCSNLQDWNSYRDLSHSKWKGINEQY